MPSANNVEDGFCGSTSDSLEWKRDGGQKNQDQPNTRAAVATVAAVPAHQPSLPSPDRPFYF